MKMKWNYEQCEAAAKKYSTKIDFKTNEDWAYQWLIRNKLLEQACAHMVPTRRALTGDLISEIAGRYTSRRAFKLGDQSAYMAARKRGILDQVCAHMSGDRYRLLTDEQIAEIARGFDTMIAFRESDPAAYQTANKRKILSTICAHMTGRPTRRLSDDEILQIAKQFKTRNEFSWGDFGAYTTAIRRGLMDQACAHMEYGYCGFREDKPAVLYQFRVETVDGLVLYKIGITNRKPKQRLLTMGIQRGTKAELVHFIRFDLGRDARIAEKRLHRRLSAHRYDGPPIMKNGNTEIFTVAALD
jgi:hypothetical protein